MNFFTKFKGRVFVGLVLVALVLVAGCAPGEVQTVVVTQVVAASLTPEPERVTVEVPVTVTDTPTEEATEAATEEATPTEEPAAECVKDAKVYIGNEENNPDADDLECYFDTWLMPGGSSTLVPVSFTQLVPVLGRLDPALDLGEWVLIQNSKAPMGACWLSDIEITLPEGLEWEQICVAPVYVPPSPTP